MKRSLDVLRISAVLLSSSLFGCSGHEHAPPIDPSIATSTSPSNRFDVVVPGRTRVSIIATCENPDDRWYRAFRYDRLSGESVQQTGRREWREGAVELPAMAARTSLYIDAVQHPVGATGGDEPKSKLSWKSFGAGTWRLFFNDRNRGGRKDDLVVTVRFNGDHQGDPPQASRPNAGAEQPDIRAAPRGAAAAAVAPPPAGAKPTTRDHPTRVEPSWVPATQPVRIGDVQVRLATAEIGDVPLVNTDTGEMEQAAGEPLLALRFTLENLNPTRKVPFRSWTDMFSRGSGNAPTAVDNHGNSYKRLTFGLSSRPAASSGSGFIYPGQPVTEVIVFERPIRGIGFLNVTLPAKNVGAEGSFYIQIPASMINQ